MAGLLYFFPGLAPSDLRTAGNRLDHKRLAPYGLAESLRDVVNLERQATLWQITGQGPGGASGTVLTTLRAGQPTPRMIYAPDAQRWERCWLDPPLWIGLDTEYPPTPEDLARPDLMQGFTLILADDHQWTIPLIRMPDGRDRLPHDVYIDAEGHFQDMRKPSAEVLWQRTERIAQFIFSDESKELGLSEALEEALAFFGLNYRYGPREHYLLRLIDAAAIRAILGWVVGEPLVFEERQRQKKTEAAAAPTSP